MRNQARQAITWHLPGPFRAAVAKGADGRYEVVAGLRAMKTNSRPGRSGALRTSVSS
jgi:hypothetical protein